MNSLKKTAPDEWFALKQLKKSSKWPFDIACSVTFKVKNQLSELKGKKFLKLMLKRFFIDIFILEDTKISTKNFCPKCATPWIAGFYSTRLVPKATNKKLRLLKKREKAGRLSSLDKKIIEATESGCNISITKCTRCSHELIKPMAKPVHHKPKKMKEVPVKEEKTRSKKKKVKDKNAGLKLDFLKKVEDDSKVTLLPVLPSTKKEVNSLTLKRKVVE